MLSRYRQRINAQFERLAIRASFVPPNIITVTSLVLSLLTGYVFYLKALQIAGLMLLVSGGLDAMDGAVARVSGRTSRFGGFLDSTFDRISDFAVLGGIAFSEIVDWRIVLIAAFGSFMVPYCRARGEAAGSKNMAVGIAERAERSLILVVASIIHPLIGQANILEWAVAITGVLAWVTVTQRINAARKTLAG